MTISDSRLDELLAQAEEDLATPWPRRREVVSCVKFRGMWIVLKVHHRPGHSWDGRYVAQSGCGMFETRKPKDNPEDAINGAKQHITMHHYRQNDCPEGVTR